MKRYLRQNIAYYLSVERVFKLNDYYLTYLLLSYYILNLEFAYRKSLKLNINFEY